MSLSHDILPTTKRMLSHVGCTVADLAAALDRQQSALHRTLSGNPSVRILMEVAWALGITRNPQKAGDGREYHWLCMPQEQFEQHVSHAFILPMDSPVVRCRSNRLDRKLTAYATQGRGPDFDPTDKQMLAEVYPSKAIEGASGAPIDSRFIEAPPEPSPVAHSARSKYRQADVQQTEAPASDAPESFEQRQQRLSEGAPDGYRLSAKALSEAPRTPYKLWQQGGWDIDKLIHHGYLEETETPERPGPAHTDAIEARRVEASIGCPDGWILSDKALEVEGATYAKLEQAMGLAKLKDERFLVPRSWLGYD